MAQESGQPITVESLDEIFWDDLLAFIEEKRVVPIIGPDLVLAELEGSEIALYRWLAAPLAERLRLPAANGAERSLNDVVCEFLSRRGRREDVYPRLSKIVKETALEPSTPLRQLARITDFNLYVTTTFDDLLERALNEERFRGEELTEVLSYAPNKVVDLPCEKEKLPRPTVYHLLGKLAAAPSFAVAEEDVLEFICALQSEHSCPETLFSELENNNLLLLGCQFSDWLGRFFLRMAKRRRLSEPRDFLEVIADNSTPRDPELVLFLQNVSSRTKLFRGGDAKQFVAELWNRWSARQPKDGEERVPGARPVRFLPPAHEMPEGAIFISYAHEDLTAAQELKAGLDAVGLETWFDVDRLEGGDDYDRKIQRNIAHCTFFLPIISATTERREEAYFRREWSYAVDRARAIAEGALFILPIVIDETKPAGAKVPERFTQVQWTPLPGGRTTPEFSRRMTELMGSKA